MKPTVLDKAYKDEHDADVKERILLVSRVLIDKQYIESVAQELHKSRAWANKWYKRYKGEELDGLKDKPSGRLSLVEHDLMIKIRKELEDSNTGWDFRQVMDNIQKRTISSTIKCIYIDCCINGALNQRYLRRDS